jgi:hypothetical protein
MIEELFEIPFSVSFEISFVLEKGIVLGLEHVRGLTESRVETVREKARLHGDEQLALTIVLFPS